MRRGSLAVAAAAVVLLIAGSVAPSAGAGGPLTLKRTVVVKHGVKLNGGHYTYRTVLRSPGKGVVGTARVRCSLNDRCSIRTKFSEGRVTARGPVGGDGIRQTLPIVGGNGAFHDATGKFVARPDRKLNRVLWIYKLASFG
jgi:hypothetical protein